MTRTAASGRKTIAALIIVAGALTTRTTHFVTAPAIASGLTLANVTTNTLMMF